MKVIFTCGGTAGHVNPALALAGLIRERKPDSEILFVGARRGIEKDLIEAATIIVSEETGGVSVAAEGRIVRGLDQEGLRNQLKALQKYEPETKRKGLLKRRLRNAKQDNQVDHK